jgi:hypothetical protein
MNTFRRIYGAKMRLRPILITTYSVVLLISIATQTIGHEARIIGGYRFVVGFRNEPAFSNELNAFDLTITRASDSRPINRSAGDLVDLQVEIQFRNREAFDSRILRRALLEDPLNQVFQTTNRYNSWFKPTVEGTYGFRITGTVSDVTDPQAGPRQIDETFVCGEGTRAENGSRFGCIRVPQSFPRLVFE